MLDWTKNNGDLLVWLTVGSVGMFFASLAVGLTILVRMPADYFTTHPKERRRDEGHWGRRHPVAYVALRVARNVLGWLLVAAGVAMLLLPGQGVLMILIGVGLAEFPGKHRLERWIISRRKVLKSANWLRSLFEREPLRLDNA